MSDAHRITKEIDQSELPPARPAWHDALLDIVDTLRTSGDLSVRGALALLDRMGVHERSNKRRAA
jgi:hypothetical protein